MSLSFSFSFFQPLYLPLFLPPSRHLPPLFIYLYLYLYIYPKKILIHHPTYPVAGLEASLARSQEIAAAYHAELETRPLPPTPSPPPFSPVTPPPPPKKRRRREASLLGPVDPETGRGAKRACKVARNYHE